MSQMQQVLQRQPKGGDQSTSSNPRHTPGVQPDGSQLLVPGLANLDEFVSHLRNASPYIEGHRGCTFVLVIPGEVLERKDILNPMLEDISLLHVLGVKLVVVLGAKEGIDRTVRAAGGEVRYVGGQRVTDAATMQAAVQAAGAARMQFEARLSKGPAVPMVRRHMNGNAMRFGPQVQTVSGNYVAAKRKGVVGGVDLGCTGMVRSIEVASVNRQLDAGYMVLLSNLGYSASGEVLNCDIWTVATRAAVDLRADKIICMTLPEFQVDMGLASWTPLPEAQRMLNQLAASRQPGAVAAGPQPGDAAASVGQGEDLDFDNWQALELPMALCTACAACGAGVRRAHLVDASVDGGLLLELYSREGAHNAAMISSDFYQGMRKATTDDLAGIAELLAPLEQKGILKPRTREQLKTELPHYTVIDLEGQLLGCALLAPLDRAPDGVRCAEVAAFCVAPEFRGTGRGDTLLDYLEKEAAANGTERLVLLTTRTADWFEQRGFQHAGPAHLSGLLPEPRRAKIDPARNSKLFTKEIASEVA